MTFKVNYIFEDLLPYTFAAKNSVIRLKLILQTPNEHFKLCQLFQRPVFISRYPLDNNNDYMILKNNLTI